MLKNYIYLNTLFIFGLILYILTLNFQFNSYDIFYIFFSIFAIIVPVVFILCDYKYQNLEERNFYRLLFLGFLSFGVGNLGWYVSDKLEINFLANFLNLIFIFQVITKQLFFKYIISTQATEKKDKNIEKIVKINIGILLISMFLGNSINISNSFFNIYFILESVFSIIFILKYLHNGIYTHLDVRYFLTGSILWLIGDIIFFNEILLNNYFVGSYSDFTYFVGYYLMLASIIFKNFNWTENLNSNFYFKIKLT